jgi:hypothetical protein
MVRYVQLEVREPGLGILLACKADFASSESPIFKHLTDRTDFLLKMAEKYPENFDPVPRRDYPDNPPDSNQMIQRRVWGILSRFAAVPARRKRMELRGLQLFADRAAQYKEDLVLQLWALQLVKNYTRGGIDVLVNAGAVELLVRAMQLHKHDALRRDAMQALHAILANKESRERAAEIVSKAGGVEEVLEILALHDDKLSPMALSVISNLLSYPPVHTQCEKYAKPVYLLAVDALAKYPEHAEIQRNGAGLLYAVMVHSTKLRWKIVHLGFIQIVMDMWMAFQDRTDVLRPCAQCFTVFAEMGGEAIDQIVEYEIPNVLLNALDVWKDKQELKLLSLIMLALESLTSAVDAQQLSKMINRGIVRMSIDAMKIHGHEIRVIRYAASCLASVADNRKYQDRVEKAGGFPVLLKAFDHFSDFKLFPVPNPHPLTDVCFAMRNCCFQLEEVQDAWGEKGVTVRTMDLLHKVTEERGMINSSGEARFIHAICSLLCNLCIASANNRARVLGRPKVVELLTLHMNDPKIYQKSSGETGILEKIDPWNEYDFMALETLEGAVLLHEASTKRKK